MTMTQRLPGGPSLWAQATMVQKRPATAFAPSNPDATAVLRAPARLIVATPHETAEYDLAGETLSLGRDSMNDIVVAEPCVSRRHAALRPVDGTYEIVDLGSANGLSFGGERISRRILADGDVVTIGDEISLTYRQAPEPEAQPAGAVHLDLEDGGRLLIGRLAANDLVIDHPAVSRFHARISRQGDGYVVEDLESANGTFVNGERIARGESWPLQAGDTVRIGAVKLVASAGALDGVDESHDLRLDALHLNQPAGKGVNLLQDISLSIQPREFVAVVGVSGAGKSTLLGALNGFRPARRGVVLVNGEDLYRTFDAQRANLGFVPQDDIIHLDLPVQRALDYAAQLRLPADTTTAERRRRVEEVMAALGLSERCDVTVRNLSGGQRKRVSLGVELLTRPGLLFLDEATSGLDPGTESQMMRLLRRLADEGHTVLLVTHATKNVALCDQVVFLAKGGYLAWYGPPREALAYFGVEDFDAIYEKLEGELTPAEWARRYRESAQYQTFVAGRLRERYGPSFQTPPAGVPTAEPANGTPAPAGGAAHAAGVSALRQVRILSARYLDIIRRDRAGLVLLFLVPFLLGAIDLLAWPRDILDRVNGTADRSMTMFFLATIIPFLVGGLGSVREIVKEAAIYRRERMVTLKVVPYLLSKVWVALLFSLYSAAVLLGFKLLAVDLSAAGTVGVLALYVTLALAVMSGAMCGLLLSALARREEQVMMLIVLLVVVQIVFSGGILPLRNLGVAGQALGSVTSSKWVFEAQVAAAQVKQGDCDGTGLADCTLPGIGRLVSDPERRVLVHQVDERFRDVFGRNIYRSWAALGALLAALFAALVVVQKRKDAT
jgi:ABC-type multidrug transport system ATPase subunit